ncbi:tRNA (adenine(22)-N(1))-methyltransferase [Cohnella hongkongensis]|uniref:tRNA (Adenine(22)-N(1))-methyltransferase n=1 Tax=Cohnella hongkongensis TaxID=178337 RepID=A0ABV9FDV5_9BACL
MTDRKETGAAPKLSRRLTALAERVSPGARLADIGTDHALLPVYLALEGTIEYAVAGDIHAGPVNAARRQVAQAGLETVVDVRLGDGMSVLRPGEVDTVAIAGMGGSLMVRILEQAGERLNGVETLVLSPHVAEDAVRRWLSEHRYVLDDELLLEEDGVIYTLLRATYERSPEKARELDARLYDERLLAPAIERMPRSLLYEMGPLLLRSPSGDFHRKWEQEIAKRERVILQLKHSAAPEAAEKAREWEEDVKEIREVLACLPGGKRSFN